MKPIMVALALALFPAYFYAAMFTNLLDDEPELAVINYDAVDAWVPSKADGDTAIRLAVQNIISANPGREYVGYQVIPGNCAYTCWQPDEQESNCCLHVWALFKKERKE